MNIYMCSFFQKTLDVCRCRFIEVTWQIKYPRFGVAVSALDETINPRISPVECAT